MTLFDHDQKEILPDRWYSLRCKARNTKRRHVIPLGEAVRCTLISSDRLQVLVIDQQKREAWVAPGNLMNGRQLKDYQSGGVDYQSGGVEE